MVSSYEAGYYAGRWCTKYLTSKLVERTVSKVGKISKYHKIDSKNAEVVTENIFEH